MQIRGVKVEEGIKIKTKALTERERKIMAEAIAGAMRRIRYGRKQENKNLLPYVIRLN